MTNPGEGYKLAMADDRRIEIIPMHSFSKNVLTIILVIVVLMGFALFYLIDQLESGMRQNRAETLNNREYTVTNYNVGLKNRLVYCETLVALEAPISPTVHQLCNDPALMELKKNPNQIIPSPNS